jgi:hypothetical protein
MGTQAIANKKDKHRKQLKGVRESWETSGRNREMKMEFKPDLQASKLINLESRFLVIVYTGELKLIIKSKQEQTSLGSSLHRKSLSSRSQN